MEAFFIRPGGCAFLSLQKQVATLLRDNSGYPAERSVKATSKTVASANPPSKPTKESAKQRGALRPAFPAVRRPDRWAGDAEKARRIRNNLACEQVSKSA